MPRQALVYEAHDYEQGTANCRCEDAAEHAPCAVCAAGRDSYIHDPEAKVAGALLTVVSVTDTDTAVGGDESNL